MKHKHAYTATDEARLQAAKALQTALDRRDSAAPPRSHPASR
jgi:hypothetical protein